MLGLFTLCAVLTLQNNYKLPCRLPLSFPLRRRKHAAATKLPIPITRVKHKTKVAASNLTKFEFKDHPHNEDSILKNTKTVHWISADSSPEETLLWSQDQDIKRTSTADSKITTL